MSFFFSPFQKIIYDMNKDGNYTIVTNILNRFAISDLLQDKRVLYFDHTVTDHERPDTVAYDFYGDATLDWIIFMTNQIIDPQWQWVLKYEDFNNYLINKYGSVEASTQQVHHYEMILTQRQTYGDGTILPGDRVIVDQTTYNSLEAYRRNIVYCYDWEVQENEKKRNIKILQPPFVAEVLGKIQNVFN